VLARTELRASPVDGGHGVPAERVVRAPQRGGVVVAEYNDGAVRSVSLDELEHPYRVGPVAHEVAEKHVPVRPQRVRMRKARGDRLEIAVDIGEEGELQIGSVFWMRYPNPRTVTISTPAASSFLRNRCT